MSSCASSNPPSVHADSDDDASYHEDEAITGNPFDSESSRILFDAMDQLQSCEVAQQIAVPQLIIVGGQSAGKSSLLQSLIEIPFPVGAGCCTRFATRIVSKRTASHTQNKFRITITEPEVAVDGFNYPPDERYKQYTHAGEYLSASDFENVMQEVSDDYLGINRGLGRDKKNFATQVLRIELSGPSRSHFSILDIPGVISNPHEINEDEMVGVKQMVTQYMEDERNIVICVADAPTDLARQDIFHMARKYDRNRIVGVFTKCDLVGDPDEVVSIVSGGTANAMSGSWFVVRNRSSKDDRSFDVAAAEANLFNKAPWTSIPPERRGSTMLRRHLSNLLCTRIRREFPEVQRRIREQLDRARRDREALGAARVTVDDQRQFLRDIAHRFEKEVSDIFDKPGFLAEHLQLRSQIREANDGFAKTMKTAGHRFAFEHPGVDPVDELVYLSFMKAKRNRGGDRDEDDDDDEDDEDEDEDEDQTRRAPAPVFKGALTPPTTPERKIKNMRNRPKPARAPTPDVDDPSRRLLETIRQDLRGFRSTELPGFYNPAVLRPLFAKQTEQWPVLAEAHLDKVAGKLDTIVSNVLVTVCPPPAPASSSSSTGSGGGGGSGGGNASADGTAYHGLFDTLLVAYRQSVDRALASLRLYCERERKNILQTTDVRFEQRITAWRKLRMFFPDLKVTRVEEDSSLDQLTVAFNRMHYSIEDNMVREIHDALKVYYEITLESFVRHVNHNIIESFVTDPAGPLRCLTQQWAYGLPADEVERLAREDEETLARRAGLDGEICKLEAAHRIAERARMQTGRAR